MPELPTLPPIATEPISVVLLAPLSPISLDEEIERWIQFLNGLSHEYEILLVKYAHFGDDLALTEAFAARFPRVRVLHETAPGEGVALRNAFVEVRHPLVFYTVLGGQFQPENLKLLLNEIDKVHLVSGFRFWQKVPSGLRLLGRIYRGIVRWLFGLPLELLPGWLGWKGQLRRSRARWVFGVRLHDVECAFRLFRREILRRIPIQSTGPFVHIELLAKANFLGHLIAEVPVKFKPADEGKPQSSENRFRDGRNLFFHPDFGPAVLPEDVQPSFAG